MRAEAVLDPLPGATDALFATFEALGLLLVAPNTTHATLDAAWWKKGINS